MLPRGLPWVVAIIASLAACAPAPPPWHDQVEPVPSAVGEADFDPPVAEAHRELRAAWEEARTGRDRAGAADAAGRLGMWLHAYRDFPAAAAAYRNARRLAPREGRWSYLHGRVLRVSGDVDGAREALRSALEQDPGDRPARAHLVELELLAGRPEEAAALLAGHAGPEAPPFLAYLAGRAAFEAGDPAAAVPLLERALEQAPGAVAAHQALGLALRDLGREEEARHHLERAATGGAGRPLLLDDPRMAEVQVMRSGTVELARAGRAALQGGRFGEAVEALSAAAERDPDRADVRIQLARALLAQGRPLEAERVLREAVAREPDFPAARLALGGVLARRGDLVAAEAELRQAHRLDPASFEAAWQLAEVLRHTHRCNEAVPLYRRAADLDPTRPDPVYEATLCLLRAGRHDEARRDLEAALPRFPGHPDLARLAERLGSRKRTPADRAYDPPNSLPGKP